MLIHSSQMEQPSPQETLAVARVSYGRFLDYINSGRVTSVDIFDGGRNAVIETIDSDLDNKVQRLRVDLPGLTPELISNLKDEGISFDVRSCQNSSSSIRNIRQFTPFPDPYRRFNFTQEDQMVCLEVQVKQCNLKNKSKICNGSRNRSCF